MTAAFHPPAPDGAATGSWGDGRYQARHLLGRGGTAQVWLAEDRVLGRPVAVKTFAGDGAHLPFAESQEWTAPLHDDEAVERFVAEVRLLSRLEHPQVIALLDAGVDPSVKPGPWYVMPVATGGSLGRPSRPLTPGRLLTVATQVAGALAYVHAEGVVHRDLKPDNILLDGDQRAYLCDFGIARHEDLTHRTRTGVLLGTAAYLAPEQVRGDDVTSAADVYSLGLLLLESLTGRREFQGPPIEAALARLTRVPIIPERLGPAWRELLGRMTQVDAADRPSAAEVRDTLLRMASDDRARPVRTTDAGESARPAVSTVRAEPAAGGRRPRMPRHHVGRALTVAVAAVVVAALAVGVRQLGTDLAPDLAGAPDPARSAAGASPSAQQPGSTNRGTAPVANATRASTAPAAGRSGRLQPPAGGVGVADPNRAAGAADTSDATSARHAGRGAIDKKEPGSGKPAKGHGAPGHGRPGA